MHNNLPKNVVPRHVMALTLCLLSGWSSGAWAIVNIEDMRIGSPRAGFSGSFSLTFDGSSGNTRTAETGLNARLQWQQARTTDFVIAAYDYAKSNDVRNTNRRFLHARHVRQFAPTRAWEAFAQAAEDEFARLSFRRLLGGGLRFVLAEEPKRTGIYFGIGAFFAAERLAPRAGTNDAGDSTFWQGNLYLSYKHRINDSLNLASTTYYQPRLDNGADMRILEQAALKVRMTDQLSLKLLLNLAYDSRPPEEVKRTDTSYLTALHYQF